MKKKPQLSILIPCIPSRFEKAQKLIDKLQAQIVDKNVEIICLIDNKLKSIGEKRDNLVQVCNGKYFMFIDDDDDIDNLDDVYEKTFLNVDVIFKSHSADIHTIKLIEGLALKAKGHMTDDEVKVVKVIVEASGWGDIISII
jgi:glycosyltransferase involved in cell wall biosynthesis